MGPFSCSWLSASLHRFGHGEVVCVCMSNIDIQFVRRVALQKTQQAPTSSRPDLPPPSALLGVCLLLGHHFWYSYHTPLIVQCHAFV